MFESILYESHQESAEAETIQSPDCFKDLNLDQIFVPIIRAQMHLI